RMAASSSMIKMLPAPALVTSCGRSGIATALDIYCFPHKWEFKVKRGALAFAALHPNFAGMLLDDSVGDRQAETSAAALAISRCGLGCKEWIVDAADVL